MLTKARVRELLSEHGLTPSRALGQNFVVDPNTVRRIARLAHVGPGDAVVEIGPGLGSLTLALAETGAQVTAVELDRALVPVLRSVVDSAGVTVVHGDALALDWESLLGAGPPRWVMVGNLPYNIAARLVLHLLEDVPRIARMLVMVQREVGERLAAKVGEPAYGLPSLKVAYWAAAKVVGRVPATVFLPRPRVESVLVELVRHDRPPVDVEHRQVFELADAGFGKRRKTLRRSLAGLVSSDDLLAAGIRPEARAEELSLHDWARLAGVRE